MLTLWRTRPVANSITEGMPMPTARAPLPRRPSMTLASWSMMASELSAVGSRSPVVSVPLVSSAEAIFVPPTSMPM
jgi:hypothetical protein